MHLLFLQLAATLNPRVVLSTREKGVKRESKELQILGRKKQYRQSRNNCEHIKQEYELNGITI